MLRWRRVLTRHWLLYGCRRDDVIATAEFPICDLVDNDGIEGGYDMYDVDGNSVGTVNVNLQYEEGDGKFLVISYSWVFFLIGIVCIGRQFGLTWLLFSVVLFVFSQLLRPDRLGVTSIRRFGLRKGRDVLVKLGRLRHPQV